MFLDINNKSVLIKNDIKYNITTEMVLVHSKTLSKSTNPRSKVMGREGVREGEEENGSKEKKPRPRQTLSQAQQTQTH